MEKEFTDGYERTRRILRESARPLTVRQVAERTGCIEGDRSPEIEADAERRGGGDLSHGTA